MTENFEVTLEQGFIRVVPLSTEYPSPVQDFFTQVSQTAHKAGISKVLFDLRGITTQLSTMERFNYGSLIAEQFRGLKVTFVVNQPLRDPDRFGETVAVNRGGIIRVVETLEEAYKWLEVEPPGKSAKDDAG